jgi:D-amino-acid dehydrogenase
VSKHVVIIGAGVIGLSAAVECLRRGHRVTVLEREGASRTGCSFGNAGMIVPSHFVPLAAPGMVALGLKWMWNSKSPFYIKPRLSWDLITWSLRFWSACNARHVERSAPLLRDLHFASREAYAQLAESGEAIGLVQKGLLMLCKTQHALDEEAAYAARARELGVPAEVLDPSVAAKLDPTITMDIAGAIYFPRDCHLLPERVISSLEQRVRSAGGDLRFDVEVTGWLRKGDQLVAVRTPAGEFAADEFILCGGSWSPAIVRDLSLRLPIQAGKGYSLTLPNPVELPQICSILTEARVAVTPMDGALRVGGTMELAGLDPHTNPRRIEGILEALPRYFPKFRSEQFDGIQPWHGFRPCSPDGLPYLGRSKAASNLIVATGHAMMGLSLAPITGKLAAQLVQNEPLSHDIRLLDPDRFA